MRFRILFFALIWFGLLNGPSRCGGATPLRHWLWTTAYGIPKHTTSEGSGYFSIVEGHNGRIYVGTAKYRHNAYLVEFNPRTSQMNLVVDVHQQIGTNTTGFAAQAKIHTRNHVGKSGKIYFGTKQGYPKDGEQRSDYPGGYPMVYDPATGSTCVYDIPIQHQGIISIVPDESRGVAYLSTCSDDRPRDITHFMQLDLRTGAYRNFMNCRHMYAFIVVDYLGRAYHPTLGGQVARYDPRTDTLERLEQTIDDLPPTDDSLLAHPNSHPINWELSPDRKTLYAVAMNSNQLYGYDLTVEGDTLRGSSIGKLIPTAEQTDCRAMCVAPNGTVWAGVAATFAGGEKYLHLVSFLPGDASPIDHRPIAIGNPDYTEFTNRAGESLAWHHGTIRLDEVTLVPRYVIMGICAARDGTVYLTTLYPFTLHAIRIPRVAGITTVHHHNSHSDMLIGRLMETDTLNGSGDAPPLHLSSFYTDQVPENDTSRQLARSHNVPIHENVTGALTLGTGKLAVDGVLLVAEHGQYPQTDTGQTLFPKRRLFEEVIAVFRQGCRVVPVFNDKHLADNWRDAKWIYDTARQMKIPMMAGSSLPVTWRYPPVDVRRGARLERIAAISFGSPDAYGFHAMEMVQCLAERRMGGEKGIAAVQCLSGDAAWKAIPPGTADRQLLDTAFQVQPPATDKTLEQTARGPLLFVIQYRDGLRATILHCSSGLRAWSAAWRYAETSEIESALFWTQKKRPFHHFHYQLLGIEKMMYTGRPTWPVERTLLTSGALYEVLRSRAEGGKLLATPHLDVRYSTDWNWQQPPPPPTGRPVDQQ